MALSDKLAYTLQSVRKIRAAIEDCGVDMTDNPPLGVWDSRIRQIQGQPGTVEEDHYKIKFAGCSMSSLSRLVYEGFESFEVPNVKELECYGTRGLVSVIEQEV